MEEKLTTQHKYKIRAIDKAKGIIAKPMPENWYNWHATNGIEDEEEKEYYRRILAEKKPYFMRMIYGSLSAEYNTYVKAADKNALREFGIHISDLLKKSPDELTEHQAKFIACYEAHMPTSNNDCVVNRICRRFEEEFDGFVGKAAKSSVFDYGVLRNDEEYSGAQRTEVRKLYNEYTKRIQDNTIMASLRPMEEQNQKHEAAEIRSQFKESCIKVCSNEKALCNLFLDSFYTRAGTKKIVWDLCGEEITRAICAKKNGIASFPVADPDGDIVYGGRRFSVKTANVMKKDEEQVEV